VILMSRREKRRKESRKSFWGRKGNRVFSHGPMSSLSKGKVKEISFKGRTRRSNHIVSRSNRGKKGHLKEEKNGGKGRGGGGERGGGGTSSKHVKKKKLVRRE